MDNAAYTLDITDTRRMEHSALRLRMLTGCWGSDLSAFIASHIDPTRAVSWGEPSKAVNLLRSIVGQLSVTYDETPTIRNSEAPDLTPLDGVFHLHQRHEDYVLSMRESLIRVSWTEASHLTAGGIAVRLVTPSDVVVEASIDNPGVPALIRERRPRRNPETGKIETFWDVWDVRDAGKPSFTIRKEGRSEDYTPTFAPELKGAYPYRSEAGAPFLPFVLYHARDTGQLWDPYAWDEVVDGTLALGLYYTFFNHAVKDASWVQKYAIDAELAGTNTDGEDGYSRSRIPVDPTSLLLFRSRGEGNATLGSFPLPMDPLKLIEAIRTYQEMVCDTLGLSGAEIQSAQSGAAIKIRRDKVRAMAARSEPQFRRGDTELLSKCAMIWNLYGDGERLPETGYQVTYTGVPLSHDELTAGLDRDLKLIAEGLLSRVDLMMSMNPGMTRVEAQERLAVIASENAGSPGTTGAEASPPQRSW